VRPAPSRLITPASEPWQGGPRRGTTREGKEVASNRSHGGEPRPIKTLQPVGSDQRLRTGRSQGLGFAGRNDTDYYAPDVIVYEALTQNLKADASILLRFVNNMTGSPRPSIAERDANIRADDLVGWLYRTDESTVLDAMNQLSPQQRADVAVFCYQKAHLHHIGLAIAATCDPGALIQALGTVRGRILFAQSREGRPQIDRRPPGQRRKITLATRAKEARFACHQDPSVA
jgi:hypothetical protein